MEHNLQLAGRVRSLRHHELQLNTARTLARHSTGRHRTDRLGINKAEQISIFDVIEQQEDDLILDFQPLGKQLYGAYVKDPSQRLAGIVVHRQHPLYLQRSTAAHEYGHHVMGHSTCYDGGEEIEPHHPSRILPEVEAQAFASYFLMPHQLVNSALRRRHWPNAPDALTGEQLYQLSLEFGVNFAAIVNHFETLQMLTWKKAAALRNEQQMRMKSELLRTVQPPDSRSSVWLLRECDSERHFFPRVDDVIRIDLDEPESSTWIPADDKVSLLAAGDDSRIELLASDVEIFSPATRERGGVRHLYFRLLRHGQCVIHLERQSVESSGSDSRCGGVFDVVFDVQPRHRVLLA